MARPSLTEFLPRLELFLQQPRSSIAAIVPQMNQFLLPPGENDSFIVLATREQFLEESRRILVPFSVQLLLKFNSKNVESGYKLLKSLKAQNRRCKTESIKRNEIIPIQIYLGNYFGRNVGCSTIKYKYKHEK